MKYGDIKIISIQNDENKVLITDTDGSITSSSFDISAIGGADELSEFTDVSITSPLSGENLKYDGTVWVNKRHLEDDVYIVVDSKSSGTAAGTFTSGSWQTRVLNTTRKDTDWASLSSNQITLVAGTYLVDASAPANRSDSNKLRFQKISGTGTSNHIGNNMYVWNTSGEDGIAYLTAVVDISAATGTYELQHRTASTTVTEGLGTAASFGVNEVYATVKITRIE